MTWNYRIMRRKNSVGIYEFGIYEVYYDKSGKLEGWTENSIAPFGESEEELLREIDKMKDAFTKEILDYDKDENLLSNRNSVY